MAKDPSSLHQLSRAPLSPGDRELLRTELLTGTDRAVALIACAATDQALIAAIAAHLVGSHDTKFVESIFYSMDAPLGTMAHRIRMGVALGVFDSYLEKMLTQVRRVRNVFAHALRPVSFSQKSVRDACAALPATTLEQVFKSPPACDPSRGRYVSACLQIQTVLNDHADQVGRLPKPIYNARGA